jgi:hypothetical protein
VLKEPIKQEWVSYPEAERYWVCPVFTDCLPLSYGTSSQSNLFIH